MNGGRGERATRRGSRTQFSYPRVSASPRLRVGLLIHLRLHFQLLLAPIFLWGFYLGNGGLGPRAVLVFIVIHAFLYGGATAFNSAYDRDRGPVGGLKRPPTVTDELLPFSLAVLLLGWGLSAIVSWEFFGVYTAILVLALAYSHPRIRLKARPWTSLATIFAGQGLLGFLGGWTAAGAPLSDVLGRESLLGALAASLIVSGFYPLSQLFQIEDDRSRGDRTIAVAWGAERCFRLAQAAFALGGLVVLAIVLPRQGAAETIVSGLFFLALLAAVERWRTTFDTLALMENFRFAMRLNAAAALGLAGYVAWHMFFER